MLGTLAVISIIVIIIVMIISGRVSYMQAGWCRNEEDFILGSVLGGGCSVMIVGTFWIAGWAICSNSQDTSTPNSNKKEEAIQQRWNALDSVKFPEW